MQKDKRMSFYLINYDVIDLLILQPPTLQIDQITIRFHENMKNKINIFYNISIKRTDHININSDVAKRRPKLIRNNNKK